MSGIDAVKRIVEVEAQSRKIVDDAKTRAKAIVDQASQDAEKVREEILAQARLERERVLAQAKTEAEIEAGKSDVETSRLLEDYQRAFNERKDAAVQKGIELILRGQA